MLLTSVLLILQETLEAALLISMLAVVSLHAGRRLLWLPWGLVAGGVLALVYAANMQQISEWFDYIGQELTNALLQLSITLVLVPLAWMLGRGLTAAAAAAPRPGAAALSGYGLLCALAVMLAVTREGAEILVFLGGFLGQGEQTQAVLVGSGIGFGIGVSVGLLLFSALLPLQGARGRWVPVILLALVGGNMLSQAALQLIQADWLQSGPALWDSSVWLPEHSVAGRLLYALAGYESSPTATQAVCYLAGALAILSATLAGRRVS
jgi:high-affinity iron transporter